MTVKLIVRMMDRKRTILAFSEVRAETRGDGGLWALESFNALVEASGVLVEMNVHWPELNANVNFPVDPQRLERGSPLTFGWTSPMLQINSDSRPLPPVTVRQAVTIGIPSGAVGSVGR